MEVFSNFVKVTLPKYFKSLPIPSSFGGFASLSSSEWLSLAPFLGMVGFVVYATVKAILPNSPSKPPKVNPSVKKENPKVVDLVEIEDLDKEKTSYCRCWRSQKFPFCDGTHNKFNDETGDNVGPLVVKRKAKN